MIRPYKTEDKATLIDLLRLNTPGYFDPSEERQFAEYLDNFADNYFVVEDKGNIIGCGGYNFSNDMSTASISWDIVRPDYQCEGIGTKLTEYRVHEIQNTSSVMSIVVRTTQLVYQFYEKLGFSLEKIEKDFWAPGFDLYQMRMLLRKKHSAS